MAQLDRLTRRVSYGVQLTGAAWPQFLRPLVLELASHRPIREVLPGVHHWTAIHPKIRLPVDSYYIESARVALDPMVPREGRRGLLDLDFDNLLFAHGEPLIGGGEVALREFVAGG